MPPPVTVPPALALTVNRGLAVKLALTCAPVTATVRRQVTSGPVQAPDQPVKFDPAAAAATSVTRSTVAKAAEQAGGQEMPAGWLVTVPPPATVTVNRPVGGAVAVTVMWTDAAPRCPSANVALTLTWYVPA